MPGSTTPTPTTRQVVDELFGHLAAGDPVRAAALYADQVDWAIDWPDGPVAEAVPWIRHRPDRAAVRQHYSDIMAGNEPAAHPTSVDTVVIDGEHAVVLGVLRNVVVATGASYQARFALHLTVTDGAITRHHVYEDSLAVALAAGAVSVGSSPAPAR